MQLSLSQVIFENRFRKRDLVGFHFLFLLLLLFKMLLESIIELFIKAKILLNLEDLFLHLLDDFHGFLALGLTVYVLDILRSGQSVSHH